MKKCFKQLVICITAAGLAGQAALLPLCAEETGAEPAGESVVGGVAGDLGTKGEDAGAAIVEEAFSGTFAYEETETDQTVTEAPDGAMASARQQRPSKNVYIFRWPLISSGISIVCLPSLLRFIVQAVWKLPRSRRSPRIHYRCPGRM